MNIGKLVRERGDRIGFGSVRLAVFTAKVKCDSDNELWRFSRMPCALPLKPACGQKTFFITRIVCDCDHDLWRLFRIHSNTIVRCHTGARKQKQERFWCRCG